MNKQQKIIKLEKETRELKRIASLPETPFNISIEIRKIQDKKWFCLQLLKRMVK